MIWITFQHSFYIMGEVLTIFVYSILHIKHDDSDLTRSVPLGDIDSPSFLGDKTQQLSGREFIFQLPKNVE